MWLLKLHFSISVLCILTYMGFRAVFKDKIKENGYWQEKKLSTWLLFLVPILNIMLVIILFLMIVMKKDELDKKCNELKEASAESKES